MAARSGRWLAGLALALVVFGIFASGAWREHRLLSRVQAGLPVRPDLTDRPAVLGELLAKAQARTLSYREALEGVAQLGRLYHANGFFAEAEACWWILHTEQPREARWCYLLADLRRSASDYPGMTALLTETVALAPEYAPAWLQLANLQLKTGQVENAERNFRRRLALLPHDPYARLGLARLALLGNRRAEARQLIEQLLQDAPQFSTGHNLYADMLATEGDAAGASRQRWLGRETTRFREADDPWLEELQDACYDYERLCVLGTIEYQTIHGDRGKSLLERAIQLKPEEPSGYEVLGSLYLRLDDAAKARDTLEQGLLRLKTAKPSPMLYVNLSHAYRVLKQSAEAVRVARQGLEKVGDEFELYDALGAALGDLDRHEEAVAAFHQALSRVPNDTNTNFNLAMSLLSLSRWAEARAALERSLILQPTFPKTLVLLGRNEMEGGRWESAEKYLRPLYESHPEMPEARQLMAAWLLHAGTAAEAKKDLAAAERHYREASAIESFLQMPEARATMASWHWRAGNAAQATKDLAAAERHYREGVGLDPNLPELQVSLGALCLMQTRFAEAVGPLEAYHRLKPDNAPGCLYLGMTYTALRRAADARRILEQGAQLAERSGDAATAEQCREILQQR